ncbi:hypothetical protein AAFC00_002206 [Neodothiora populina]|uniref:Uncharacterized protein n=1 Tax=Neodothiora populina TaxID=2781224 RepID=A0ABR3PH17_9PEZI
MNAAQRAALLNPKQARKNKANSVKPTDDADSTTRRFDPKKLISPRAKRTYDALKGDTDHDDDDALGGSSPGSGQSSLLMKQFNVGEREHVSQKRQKPAATNDPQQPEKQKSKFGGGRSHGELGQYIKQKQDEGAAEAGPSRVVDLTDDADADDDVSITKSVFVGQDPSSDPEREVCIGMLHAKVMAYAVPFSANKVLGKMTDKWPACKISLKPAGTSIVIETLDSKGNGFGKLDFREANVLSPLLKATQMNKLRAVTYLSERPRRTGQRPGEQISESMDCRIVLYAAASKATPLGKFLSQRNMFLSKPLIVENGREVMNPHVPVYKGPPKASNGSVRNVQYGYKDRTTEEIKRDVLGMFDRLIKSEELPEMEADKNRVKTELMSHQKQALYFLTKQEIPTAAGEPPSNLWKSSYKKDGTKTWYNVISGHELKAPDLSLGGIFADMMGLGKTLSVLSRICASIDEAKDFGNSDLPAELEEHATAERNTKATLIVCPKSVLSNWDEQIKAHLNQEKIKFYIYHGQKRLQDIDELAEYDIVITAYTTVGSEFTSKTVNFSAMSKLNWYRIVLDEAHMIRNQDTNVFKAACALLSKRRWAVTGTPIQNRLDDLGALIRFLKIYPFHQKGLFEQHFMSPFKAGDPQVISNLQLLVDSMTLRRSKDKIELPGRIESVIRLDFTESESALYEAFAKDANRKLNAMVGQGANGRLQGRSYAHVLVNITRLRLICAHGRELLSEDDMKVLAGSTWDTAIDLGLEEDADKPSMTEDQIYDTFYLLRESNMDVCAKCNETIGKVSEGEADDYDDEGIDNDIIGYMTPCLHTICPRCIEDYKRQLMETQSKDNYAICPTCEQYNKAVLPPIRQSGVQADLEHRQQKKLHRTKRGGNYSGPHTKVKALVTDLLRFKAESADLAGIGEPPVRSVVFSGWTQYLDLIEIALRDNEIPFLRLDGKMSVPQRSAVLDRFKTDPEILCILVSIKAGGQGLNFTAANKVFMMEPQFNPGVEMQAVDRVHRLGQKRDVEIKRFIMSNSFEEKIVELQRKKVELAQLAHQGGKTGSESMKEKMENLRSLFR